MRSTRQPPDLQRRLRLLSALHPALAREPIDPRFLPSELLDWLERLRGLPAGASFAVLCEALRADLPERVAELQRDVAQDRVVVAEMGLEDARKDFEGAIVRLRDRGRRSEIDALASKGLKGQQDKEKLLELHKEKLLELQALDPKK